MRDSWDARRRDLGGTRAPPSLYPLFCRSGKHLPQDVWAKTKALRVAPEAPWSMQVSSSAIRRLLGLGDLQQVEALLGRWVARNLR